MTGTTTIGIVGGVWKDALRAMQPATGDAPLVVAAAEELANPDFLVFYSDFLAPYETAVPRARRIAVITEPPGILSYRPGFLAQFGTVISPFAHPGYAGRLIRSQPGLPWFYGCTFGKGRKPAWRYTFEELAALPRPEKLNAVSAVLSRKAQAPLHVARVKCAEELARRFPDNIRIFGSGFDPVDDKADAIDPYRFHLALENTRDTHYWSEKIADAYLGWAMPVYEGCTTIAASFPEASFARIDVTDIEGAARTVGNLLEAGEKAVSVDALAEARRRLLHEHSLPALLRRTVGPLVADALPKAGKAEVLRPNSAFSLKGRFRTLIRRIKGGA